MHTQKLKFKVRSVQQTDWKQTDGQTDERTDSIDRFTFLGLTRWVINGNEYTHRGCRSQALRERSSFLLHWHRTSIRGSASFCQSHDNQLQFTGNYITATFI